MDWETKHTFQFTEDREERDSTAPKPKQKMKENVLITGSGFLATAVIKKLLKEENYNLFVLSKSELKETYLKNQVKKSKIKFLSGNLSKKDSLAKHKDQLGKIDYLIHLAGIVPKLGEVEFFQCTWENVKTNILGTINLLEFLNNLSYICFSSSIAVYARQNSNQDINENAKTNPNSQYGLSKAFVEDWLKQYSQEYEVPLTVLRFTQLYGPNEPHNVFLSRFINDIVNGRIILINKGEDKKDILFIEDAAEAIRLALHKKASGIYNIASGQAQSIKDIIIMIIKKLGINEIKIVKKNVHKEWSSTVYDISKARRELGFSPKYDLSRGLDVTMQAIKKHVKQNKNC